MYGPPCPFRAVGFTWKAGYWKHSKPGLDIMAEFNGVTVDQLPFGARYASNRLMWTWMRDLGRRKRDGLPYRDGKRLLVL